MRLGELVSDVRVINLDQRVDRWTAVQGELSALGLDSAAIHRYSAHRIEPHGAIGCGYSHAGALQRFLTESLAPHCLLLEDDATFTRSGADIARDLAIVIQHEPRWRSILLSGNAVLATSSAHVAYQRVIGSQTASAYLVTRAEALRLIPTFLAGAERLRELLPQLPRQHWPLLVQEFAADMIWRDRQREGGWFILSERAVVQRPSYSDIEQAHVAYGV